mgnify:CR=1 FL=1
MGFDLADVVPLQLYAHASIDLVEHMRRAYAIWPGDPGPARAMWQGQNVAFIQADATAFLEALAAQLPSAAAVKDKRIHVNRPPYMFLDYYTAADADIFCGRDTETQIVTRLALSHRLLTLFGPSGTGKTSLLLAGVTPQLAAWDYQHIYVRALDDPLPALRRAIAARAGKQDDGAGTLREFLVATLKEGDRLVVVLDQFEELFIRVGTLAQRAFFRQLAEALDARERDVRVLLSLREDYLPHLDTARDFLPDIFSNSYRLTALERANARVAITEPAARAGVTVEPALVDALVGAEGQLPSPHRRGAGGEVSGALVEHDEHTGRVFPAALQIVLDRLYRDALSKTLRGERQGITMLEGERQFPVAAAQRGSDDPLKARLVTLRGDRQFPASPAERGSDDPLKAHLVTLRGDRQIPAADADLPIRSKQVNYVQFGQTLEGDRQIPAPAPPPGLTLTLDAYNAITHTRQREGEEPETLHGADAILASYVTEGLAHLSPEADPALAREILKALVTGEATKAAVTRAELGERLVEAGAIQRDHRRDASLVDATLLGLQHVRLLRSFERDNAPTYELTHDTLAKEIATWIDQAEMQTRVAREILRRALDNWRHAGLLIPVEALRLIHACCEDLKRLHPDELDLLFRSALAGNYEGCPYWFERARAAGVDVYTIARAGLQSNNFRIRAAAVTALGQLGEDFVDDLIGRLEDDYPQVRVAAIAVLEALQPDGAWRAHLEHECYVPAGKFIMGDDKSDRNDEKPAHEVYLDAYYTGKYLVTNAEYARYREDIKQPFTIPQGKDDHPVVSVTWYDARDYAAWAGMRLLTEAEWEKAASWEEARGVGAIPRGRLEGRKRCYPWGDEFDKTKCNTSESGIGTTTPVGEYSPAGDSPYGCADMVGNVWEWTSSLYKDYPYQADDGREDMSSLSSRVVRGGSFLDNEDLVRAAFRARSSPDFRNDYRGFRVGVGVVALFSC